MNNPFTYKKLGLTLAIASTMVLAGCNTDTETEAAAPSALEHPAYQFQPGTAPLFNPAARQLPVNTDIVFADAKASDGTANGNALFNHLDGFSTTAYFDIQFDGSLDETTVVAGQTVFLLALNTGAGDALDPENIDQDAPFTHAYNAPYLSAGALPLPIEAQVVGMDGQANNVVRIVPNTPLHPATKYLVFLTNGIENSAGDPTTVSLSYNIIRDQSAPIGASLEPVRPVVSGWERLAVGFYAKALEAAGVPADQAPALAQSQITLAYTFTTTDPHKPLLAMAAPRAALMQQAAPQIATQVTATVQAQVPSAVEAQVTAAVTAEVSDQVTALVGGGMDPADAQAAVMANIDAITAAATAAVMANIDAITDGVVATVQPQVLAAFRANFDDLDADLKAERNYGLSTPQSRDLDINAATGIDFSQLSDQLAANVGKLYTGYIKLPSYQSVANPAAAFDPTFIGENWRPDRELAGKLGAVVPPDVDGSYNVTYRYPFADQKALESVPLQLTLPESSHVPAYGAGAGPGGMDLTCGMLNGQSGTPLENGYPVAIYIHGITSDRASVVALGHTLASQCVATVAIDLPVHGIAGNSAFKDALNVERVSFPEGHPLEGESYSTLYDDNAPRERHYNVASVSNTPAPMSFAEGSAHGSGGWFINLGVLTNTRDNLRQGVMDLLNLNASLQAIAQLNIDGDDDTSTLLFDASSPYVVGVSLGGIVGSVFTTVNQQAIGADMEAGFVPNLNPVRGLVTSAAGSQLSQILNHSPSFGPVIRAGLEANDVLPETANYETFLYIAQSTVDVADPVNFVSTLAKLPAQLAVPVLVQQIVGGGNASGLGDTKTYTADKVVPNAAPAGTSVDGFQLASAPLAGTTPFAALLEATQTAAGVADATAGNVLVNLMVGHHASVLRPSEDGVADATAGEGVATAELQTQVASFVLSGGAQIAVGSAPKGHPLIPDGFATQFIEAP